MIYKFADDRARYLTALITYYGFLSLFRCLLLLVTILGFVLQNDAGLQAQRRQVQRSRSCDHRRPAAGQRTWR